MKKRILAILLSLVLLLALAPAAALADGLYVSVNGVAFTEFGQTIKVGGGTATLNYDYYGNTILELNNVSISKFDQLQDDTGLVYKCGIVMLGAGDNDMIKLTGINTITAPGDKSDAIYEGIYIDNSIDIRSGTLNINGMDIGIETTGDYDDICTNELAVLNFYNCEQAIATPAALVMAGDSSVNISGGGSLGVAAGSVGVTSGCNLNIELYDNGMPQTARYGVIAPGNVEITGNASIKVGLKDVAALDEVVVNAILANGFVTVAPGAKLTAWVYAENCPQVSAAAIIASTVSTSFRTSVIDSGASIVGLHTGAFAIICNELNGSGAVSALVKGAAAEDAAMSVGVSVNGLTGSVYAGTDAAAPVYGAIALPCALGAGTGSVLTNPANGLWTPVTVDGTTQYIVTDANGKPAGYVYINKDNNPFIDTGSLNTSYKDAIAWAVANGVTGGYTDCSFRPGNICTRAQVVTFLWRANGSPAPKSSTCSFTDVAKGAYYYDAVLWAVENGITGGYNETTFGSNDPITRAQAVTFLWRSCGKTAPAGSADFPDLKDGAYYLDAVAWAAEKGITGGYANGCFGPNDPCTRAQIVTFLHRTDALKTA